MSGRAVIGGVARKGQFGEVSVLRPLVLLDILGDYGLYDLIGIFD